MTLTKPDMLPAIPYVDQILWSAFSVHPLVGTARRSTSAGGVALLRGQPAIRKCGNQKINERPQPGRH